VDGARERRQPRSYSELERANLELGAHKQERLGQRAVVVVAA
jgi:hypothetical protein